MNIAQFLRELEQKDAARKFSQDDANRLVSLISLVPCYLDGSLLIMNLAWEYPDYFPKSWNEYYIKATELGEQCWKVEEIVQFHMLAATLYSHNQQTNLASQSVKTAFDLAPQNWLVVDAYISKTRPIISEQEAIPLINKIPQLAAGDSLAYYRQGFLLERYANYFEKEEYKQAALRAYQQAISLGLGINTSPTIVDDAKGAFRRLNQNYEADSS